MAAPIYNPAVPCVLPIPGGMYPGRLIKVQGNTPNGAQRFAINLQCGPNTNPRDDIALHLNFRFVEQCVVRNHLTAMNWGVEELGGGMPLGSGANFEAMILCEPGCFKIALNGVHFCEFMHRVPFQRVSYITVDGDVSLQFVGFEGAPQLQQTQPQQPYGQYGAPQYGPPPAYGAPGYGPQGQQYQQQQYQGGYQQQQRGSGGGGPGVMGAVGAAAVGAGLGGLGGYMLGQATADDNEPAAPPPPPDSNNTQPPQPDMGPDQRDPNYDDDDDLDMDSDPDY